MKFRLPEELNSITVKSEPQRVSITSMAGKIYMIIGATGGVIENLKKTCKSIDCRFFLSIEFNQPSGILEVQ